MNGVFVLNEIFLDQVGRTRARPNDSYRSFIIIFLFAPSHPSKIERNPSQLQHCFPKDIACVETLKNCSYDPCSFLPDIVKKKNLFTEFKDVLCDENQATKLIR